MPTFWFPLSLIGAAIVAMGFSGFSSPCHAGDPGSENAPAATTGHPEPDAAWVTFTGKDGPGKDRTILLVSGDEEYRSEEALPQLAKILAERHGFTCTVLFAIDPATGKIDPNVKNNIPGLHLLKDADLLVLFIRFRELPAEQMQHFADYLATGKPIVGIRTATHAFAFKPGERFSDWSHDSKTWDGGFGRQILGETWIAHHGTHGKEATRGIIAPDAKEHPITRGIAEGDIFGPTDVYKVRMPLPRGSMPIVLGQVIAGMKPTDPPVEGKKNAPMMPIAWTRSYSYNQGPTGRVFTSTMGSSQDLSSAGFRRLLVNGCYWALGMEEKITSESSVELVGEYEPSPFKFGGFKPNLYAKDHRMTAETSPTPGEVSPPVD